MIQTNKIYIYFKKLYFYFFDSIIILLGKNNKNNDFKNKIKVIWLAETGSRDFIPRTAQAISLWEEYSIPSIIIHKHYLKKIDKSFLKECIIIDKSATYSCVNRLRYSKLSGALNIVIPEELLICDKFLSQIKGTLHPRTLNYVDFVLCNSREVVNYLNSNNKNVKTIDYVNPRLSRKTIENNCSKYLFPKTNVKEIINDEFILINDALSLKFSSFDKELEVLRNQIFKSTSVNSETYLNNYFKQEEDDEKLLLKLIFEIRKDKILRDFKIIIRPHPSVDLDKYRIYFEKKFKNTSNIFIIRKGNVIEWMKESKITFHNNCTSSIEGYYSGLFNIFNFSEKEKYGVSEDFKEILLPLGIRSAIENAKKFLKEDNKNFKVNFKRFKNNKDFFHFLGKSILKSNKKIFYKSKDENYLMNKFYIEKINQFSPADRWRDAEERIIDIKRNKKIFDELLIKPLGLIGIQIGKGF